MVRLRFFMCLWLAAFIARRLATPPWHITHLKRLSLQPKSHLYSLWKRHIACVYVCVCGAGHVMSRTWPARGFGYRKGKCKRKRKRVWHMLGNVNNAHENAKVPPFSSLPQRHSFLALFPHRQFPPREAIWHTRANPNPGVNPKSHFKPE